MPIVVPQDLPASEVLASENIFVMDEKRAKHQDIRPLKLGIINLMPTKISTETQLLRRVSNMALQIHVDLIRTGTYESTHTSREHLQKFYITLEQVKDKKYDALIVTGAPVEHMSYEDVAYWDEMVEVMEWARHNVFSTMFICWAAQAALYHYYGIPKYGLDEKLFGVFKGYLRADSILTSGFDDAFYMPHSRVAYNKSEDIGQIEDLSILVSSEEAGAHITATHDNRFIFVSGHGEYDETTLEDEYKRDLAKGIDIAPPANYYHDDDPAKGIMKRWTAHSNLLFSNWLNYCVYQETPFNIEEIVEKKI